MAAATTALTPTPLFRSIQESLIDHIQITDLLKVIEAYAAENLDLVAMVELLVAERRFPEIAPDLGIKPEVSWMLHLPRICVDLTSAFNAIKDRATTDAIDESMIYELNQAESSFASAVDTAQKTKARVSCWLTEYPVGMIVKLPHNADLLVCPFIPSKKNFALFFLEAKNNDFLDVPPSALCFDVSAKDTVDRIYGWLGISNRSTAFPPILPLID